jgi:hypothetical protein
MQTKYEYQSDYMRRLASKAQAEGKALGKAEGKAEERAEALRDVLAARGLAPSAEQSVRVAECRELEQLRRWSMRAATATRIEEVFAEG